MADPMDRIVPLDELEDYQVAEGDPDVRGWEVLASDGRKIGEVDNLLVDTAAMKVRYLDVEIDTDLLEGGPDRHILIPIGYARLEEDDDNVRVDTLNSADLAGLPEYSHQPLTREYESSVRQRFDTAYLGAAPEQDFYAADVYDERRFYEGRRGTSGAGGTAGREGAEGTTGERLQGSGREGLSEPEIREGPGGPVRERRPGETGLGAAPPAGATGPGASDADLRRDPVRPPREADELRDD